MRKNGKKTLIISVVLSFWSSYIGYRDRILRKEFWAKDRDKVWYYGEQLEEGMGDEKIQKIQTPCKCPQHVYQHNLISVRAAKVLWYVIDNLSTSVPTIK
jgi:hypothetical protein